MNLSFRCVRIAPLLATVTLLGAGCMNSNSTPPTPTTSNPAATNQPASPTNSSSTATASSTPNTSDWKTYKNSVLNFQFQYPIHGSFAPEFTVKLYPLTSTNIKDGCFSSGGLQEAKHEQTTVNGIDFCHTNTLEGAAGSTYNTHTWTTKKDKWYAVLSFTKRYPTDTSVIGGCEPGGADVGKSRCAAFDVNGYDQQVRDILSTFHYQP